MSAPASSIKSSVGLLCLWALTSLSACDFISNRILNKPIAQVENRQLSAQEFSRELADKLKNLDALSAKDPKTLAVFKNQIVNDFIISTFVDFWFDENKLSLTKAEIDAEVKLVVSGYPSDSAFREALAEANLGYSEWMQKIESSLKKKRLFESLNKNAAAITEEELLSYYNDHRILYEQRESVLLAHIQVADSNQAEIVRKLLQKENFPEVAKKYSSAYTAEAEDVYGWVEKDSSPELEKVFKHRVGEIFGPVTLPGGIHIFKVLQRRPFKIRSYDESRKEVLAEVMALRETARFTAWLDGQIKRYKVKKNLSMLDSIRVETQ